MFILEDKCKQFLSTYNCSGKYSSLDDCKTPPPPPPPIYNCSGKDGGWKCLDPGDGSGKYSSLDECTNSCKPPPSPPPTICPKIDPAPPFATTKDWDCVNGVVKNVGQNKGKFYTEKGANSMCSTTTRYECRNGQCIKTKNPFALYTDDKCGGACSIVSNPNPTLSNPNDYPATANYSQTPCQDPSSFDPNKPAYNIDPRMMLGSSTLKKAASDDGNEWANYGIATHSNSKSNCGRCYQVEYTPNCGIVNAGKLCGEGCTSPYNCYPSQKDICDPSTGKCTNHPKTPLIVQSFNTGIDCSMSQYPCNFTPGSNCQETIQQCSDDSTEPSCSNKKYKFNQKSNIWETCSGTAKDGCTRRKIVGTTTKLQDDGGQFDIYMGFGGFGAFDGCTDKSPTQKGFYGGNVSDWPGYPDTRFGGAVNKQQCEDIRNVPGFKGKNSDWDNRDGINFGEELINSCNLAFSDDNPYHGNWAVKYKEVECPDNLIKTTGLALKNRSIGIDGKKLDKPVKTLLDNGAHNGFTSSMMDCCKPSCAWQDMYKQVSCSPNNNQIDTNWRSIYTVDHNGNRMTRIEDTHKLKPYIQDQPDQEFNCTSSGPVQPTKVCYYNNFCRTDPSNYNSGGKCETPDTYCQKCQQIGIGNPVNTTPASNKTQWVPDIFSKSDDKIKWLGHPNNGGNLACDPDIYPAFKK